MNLGKRIAAAVCPPVLGRIYGRWRGRAPTHAEFRSWWGKKPLASHMPPHLQTMVDAFVASEDFQDVSRYWLKLSKQNLIQLAEQGYGNFKQTVARNYFTWVQTLGSEYHKALVADTATLQLNLPLREIARKHDLFTLDDSVRFNVATALLFEMVTKKAARAEVEIPEEPADGNPPYLMLDGRKVTQDVLNGTVDYLAIKAVVEERKVRSILEIGAGSGRTSFVLLKQIPGLKYVIVDIPPALFLSQTYLSAAFPTKKVFRFRPEVSAKDLPEFRQADIAFLMPHQLKQIQLPGVDLVVAIDCLHEMKREKVDEYFQFADEHARAIYYKCWERTTVPYDQITYTRRDYPVRSRWVKLFERQCEMPSTYFEACYLMPAP